MKILYLPRFDQHGAGPRYRVYQFFNRFNASGIQIEVKPLFDIHYLNNLYFKGKRSIFYIMKKYLQRAAYILLNKKKFDLVLMDGELFPFVPYFIEKLFLSRNYIIDQDDAIFHTYDDHKSWIVRKLFTQKIPNVWRNCKHLIINNAYLETKASEMGVKKISFLPTVVDANLYKPLETTTSSHSNKKIIIGWVGSPTTVHSLRLVEQALLNIAKKSNIALYVIGANYSINGLETTCIDWKDGWNEKVEIELTNQIDIGIMPLIDKPFNKGKGGFKLIKYMAFAKPIIASPIGINSEIVEHDKNGFLASTHEEWEDYLLKLIENPELRKQFGQHGRETMVKKYSLQYVAPIFCDIIIKNYQLAKRA